MILQTSVSLAILLTLLTACEKKGAIANYSTQPLSAQTWLFDTEYIRSVGDSSWEKISLSALNNYADFSINFAFISTGKSQNCRLYAKGLRLEEDKENLSFTIRPNLIPQATITLSRPKVSEIDPTRGDALNLAISDMQAFIAACGDAHQYALGEYNTR